jgi:hypothetical protein
LATVEGTDHSQYIALFLEDPVIDHPGPLPPTLSGFAHRWYA